MVYPMDRILCSQQKGYKELLPTWGSGIMLSEKDKLKKKPHYIQYDLILFIF